MTADFQQALRQLATTSACSTVAALLSAPGTRAADAAPLPATKQPFGAGRDPAARGVPEPNVAAQPRNADALATLR